MRLKTLSGLQREKIEDEYNELKNLLSIIRKNNLTKLLNFKVLEIKNDFNFQIRIHFNSLYY